MYSHFLFLILLISITLTISLPTQSTINIQQLHPISPQQHITTNKTINEFIGEPLYDKLDTFLLTLEKSKRYLGIFGIYDSETDLFEIKRGLGTYNESGSGSGSGSEHIDENTRFRFGSITKTFVSILTMKAIDDGLLRLSTILSSFEPFTSSNIKYKDLITIEHLLQHRSGLFSYLSDPDFGMFDTTPKTIYDVINTVIKNDNNQPKPDTSDAKVYCNTGFYFLGHILKSIYNFPTFLSLLEEKLTIPLGMVNTGFYASSVVDGSIPIPRRNLNETISYIGKTHDYDDNNNGITTNEWIETKKYTVSDVSDAAGAIVSTINDLKILFQKIFVQQIYISKQSLKLMTTFIQINPYLYGFGLIRPIQFNQGWGHYGVIDEFLSSIFIIPKYNSSINLYQDIDITPKETFPSYLIVIHSSNGQYYSFDDVTIAMNSYLYGIDLPIPDFTHDYNAFSQYCGDYISSTLSFNLIIFQVDPTKEHPNPQLSLLSPQQSSTPISLALYKRNVYFNKNMQLTITFDISNNSFTLIQAGSSFLFKKK